VESLEEYVALFAADFRRRDQARWAAVYLQGLRRDLPRKNIETIARHVQLPPDLGVQDPTQALQNFINQSPWDEALLWRRYRRLLVEGVLGPEPLVVIDDVTFIKQGQASVGVQRQFSNELGEKLNCQIAVGIHAVGTRGYCPLGLRLYLPRSWAEDADRLAAAGVPEERRQRASKPQVALELLDELRAEGFPLGRLWAGTGYTGAGEFQEGLAQRGLTTQEDDAEGPGRSPAAAGVALLREKLGLDHFEGRSWRGFHHHACLVMLAFGYDVVEP
jgi:SRSO17 transposase